jgi:type II secretion system protein C
MINKFKDFLKKLSRKRNSHQSDQDDFLDDDDLPEGFEENVVIEETEEEQEFKQNWKDKFKISLPSFRKKKNEPTSDEDRTGNYSPVNTLSDVDKTNDTVVPAVSEEKISFKERISQSMSRFRARLNSANLKDWKLPEGMRSKKSENLVSLSPSLTKSIEKFLSREARENIHQVSLAVLICVITYTLGKISALALKGQPVTDSARDFAVTIDMENDFNASTLGQVRSINIFRTNTGLGSKKKVADTKCDEAQQASNLPIKLVNTVVLQDTIKSLASVQIRGDRQLQEVREGDQISNLAKIFKITRLEILVKNLQSGVCESIASDKGKESRSPISVMSPSQSREFKANKKMPGIENEGNRFNISKALLDDKMKDIASILTQAKAIKIQNPDGTLAFKMTEMDPAGIFPYLGLQDQDIITSINGKPIYDMNEVMGLFARIKNLDKLQLGVRREGTDSLLDYNIKK